MVTHVMTSRRVLIYTWFFLLFVFLVITLQPIGTTITRLIQIIMVPVVYAGGLFLIRKYRKIFWIGLLPGVFLLGLLVLPGREPDEKRLQALYVKALNRYEGSPYAWGGENQLGIDCSGLVRRGLIDSNLQLGCLTMNPRLIRAGFALWWYDCTARALLHEYRQWTKPLFKAESINAIPDTQLSAGDIAVTSDGVHILAYLGNREWIEADPGLGKVVKVKVPVENQWFCRSVQILGWTQLILSPSKASQK